MDVFFYLFIFLFVPLVPRAFEAAGVLPLQVNLTGGEDNVMISDPRARKNLFPSAEAHDERRRRSKSEGD